MSNPAGMNHVPMSAIDELTTVIANGLGDNADTVGNKTEDTIDGIFGERYRANSPRDKRVDLMAGDRNIPFAGLLHPNNPTSGVYGGMSLIRFPIPQDDAGPACSLLTFICGTRGLAPDEAILGRPGHARHRASHRDHSEAFARGDQAIRPRRGRDDVLQRQSRVIARSIPEYVAGAEP